MNYGIGNTEFQVSENLYKKIKKLHKKTSEIFYI